MIKKIVFGLIIIILSFVSNLVIYDFTVHDSDKPAGVIIFEACTAVTGSSHYLTVTQITQQGFPFVSSHSIKKQLSIENNQATTGTEMVQDCSAFTGNSRIASDLSGWQFYADWLV